MQKIILLPLFFILFIGCKKDDLQLTGKVKFKFINVDEGLLSRIRPQVFPIENFNYPLTGVLDLSSAAETGNVELNYGTYCISFFNGNYGRFKAFQVMADKERVITIDLDKE